MRRYLLDTSIAGDYIDSRRNVNEHAKELVRKGGRIGICVPVLAELWHGIEFSSTREKNRVRLRRTLPELVVWPLTEQAAEEYGRIAAELQRHGRLIGKIDMLIAAIALSLGNTTVVTANGDFNVISGLAIENW